MMMRDEDSTSIEASVHADEYGDACYRVALPQRLHDAICAALEAVAAREARLQEAYGGQRADEEKKAWAAERMKKMECTMKSPAKREPGKRFAE